METKTYSITFNLEGGKNLTALAEAGESLLEAAKKVNLAIDAPCSGNGTCGKCRVKLLSGDVEGKESRHISPTEYAEGCRLACSTKVVGTATVFVPAAALAYQNRMKVTDLGTSREREVFTGLQAELRNLDLFGDIGLELITLNLQAPNLDDPMADRERLFQAVTDQFGGDGSISVYALRKLPQVLRESGFSCICLVRKEQKPDQHYTILDFFPVDEVPVIPGIAIDIGTTSVSILLVNLQTGEPLAVGNGGNGQIRYGADVINRIIESAKPGGLDRLHRGVIDECIQPLIRELCQQAGIEPDRVYRVGVAGNTTMTHFFLKIPAEYLRLEPYVPAFFETGHLRGADIGIGVHPDAEVTIAPSIGSYVGGDITAGAFSSMIFKKEALSLLVDLGTNGELVFGNSEFLMSCACSAGPAFEGGDISCGMRATDGAIEACKVDETTMEPILTIIGPEGQKPAGLCGSGLIDMIGELFRCGIINAKGKLSREGKRVQRDEWGLGSYIVAYAAETEQGRDIALTETDIDSFIRAKGAIFSAIRTMLTMMDMPMDAIEHVYVAGGIGSGINIKQAVGIGMFPNLSLEQYHYIGNSSLSGAYAMLTSRKAADMVTEVGKSMTYLELSSHPSYMDEFVAACFLPHTDATLFTSDE
ncbi:MAG: ASKHA domain-containing protein [Treponema sp.]|nr:ASKHA domain-containing protein [Treponema sp.]